MSDEQKNYDLLKDLSFSQGGSLFGVTELDSLKDRFLLSPKELEGLEYGICVGVALSPAVLEGIEDHPTLLYKWHYRQANNLLDKIAFILSQEIIDRGFRALPIPASQIVDWNAQRGHVSHRVLGEAAGLGWRGRNNLLVTEEYGAQIRLVSVLTDLVMKPDQPVKQGCGECSQCVSVCPVRALGENPEDYDLAKCYGLLTEFSRMKGIGQHICGVCVKACPGMVSKENVEGET